MMEVVEPLDVPAPAAEREVIFIVMLSIFTFCGAGLTSIGFGPVCLGLSPCLVSLLLHTAFASFSFCRLALCLAVFRMYFFYAQFVSHCLLVLYQVR